MVSYTWYQQADTEDLSKCHSFTTAVWQTDAGLWQCVRLYTSAFQERAMRQKVKWPSDSWFSVPGRLKKKKTLDNNIPACQANIVQVHCGII